MRVLVVEDDLRMARLLKQGLGEEGHVVTLVTDGTEALEMARSCSFDVVVLDVDNGPEPLVTSRNATLYSTQGLKRLQTCLSADGVALLWSGFESPAFEAAAERAGFTVRCEPFRRERADLFHYTYVLAKDRTAERRAAGYQKLTML